MDTSDLYVHALHDAMTRPIQGDTTDALQRFLTLNAAYFLGEWLPPRTHERLVQGLATRLDGVADLLLPADETAALQLAQHARELTAVFGPTPWTERITALTDDLVPGETADWDTQVRDGIRLLRTNGNGRPLLRTHARRRLCELTHPDTGAAEAAAVPPWALQYALHAIAVEEGQTIQVAEALLAELAYGAELTYPPRDRTVTPNFDVHVNLRYDARAARAAS